MAPHPCRPGRRFACPGPAVVLRGGPASRSSLRVGPTGRRPSLLRTPRAAAPGPLPRRSPAPARRARAARVLRCAPPLRRSASCAPLRGSAGARWPRRVAPPHPLRCGLAAPPCLRSGSAAPRRGCGGCSACPLRASPARPSAPAPLARPYGPRFVPLRGPGLLLRARARAGLLSLRGVLPCAPPPRRPRWGLRGARCPLGGFAPASGSRFSRPSAAPPPRCARPRWPRSGLCLTIRKLSTGAKG